MQHTVRTGRVGKLGARELANIVYGAARNGREKWMGTMFMVLARAAEQQVGDFNAQGLANTAWAFATAGQSDALLFMMLARAAERSVGDLSAQELANTAWAFATAGQSDA